MSRYGRTDYDHMSYELDEFLREHKISELLQLVTDAVDYKEFFEFEKLLEEKNRTFIESEE